MKLAILGCRGIPAAYGGFETFAWELSRELAARGHRVTVYSYRGRTDETRSLPAWGRASLGARPARQAPRDGDPHGDGRPGLAVRRVRRGPARQRGQCAVAGLPRCAARRSRSTWTASSGSAKWGRAGRPGTRVGERLSLVLPQRDRVRRPGHQATTTASGTAPHHASSPTAPHCWTVSHRRTCRPTVSSGHPAGRLPPLRRADSSLRTRPTSSSGPIAQRARRRPPADRR